MRSVRWSTSVVAFVLLTFAGGWGAMWSWTRGERLDLLSPRTNLLLFSMLWLAALAAGLSRRIFERDAMKGDRWQSFRRPEPLVVFSILFASPVVYAVIYFLSAALGFASFDPYLKVYDGNVTDPTQAAPHAVVLGAAFFASLSFGFLYSALSFVGEAYAWFSFLAARLLEPSVHGHRLARWLVGVVVGAMYGFWYMPLAYAGYPLGLDAMPSVLLMLAYGVAVGLVAVGIWARTHSTFSVAVAMGAMAAQERGVWAVLFPAQQVVPGLGGSHGVVGIITLALLGAWLCGSRATGAISQHAPR